MEVDHDDPRSLAPRPSNRLGRGANLPHQPASIACLSAGFILALVVTACQAAAPPTGGLSASSTPAPPTATRPAAAPSVSPLPTPSGGDADWLTYVHTEPSFTFRYPPDWVVEPDANPVSTLSEHALFVRPAAAGARLALRVVFRATGDELLLWPTGVGEGEFVDRGATPFGGGWLARRVLVCQQRDQAVWYRGEAGAAELDGLEFSFILAVEGACADGLSLIDSEQAIGDMLVASFAR